LVGPWLSSCAISKAVASKQLCGSSVGSSLRLFVSFAGAGGPVVAALGSIPGISTRGLLWGCRPGLWQSSFDAHGRDHLCERPPCGCLHSILPLWDKRSTSQRVMLWQAKILA